MRFLGLVCLCLCLAACGQSDNGRSEKTSAAPANVEAADFLQDVSGVWAASQGGLITIDYRDSQLRLVIGNDPKFVKLGEIDSDQQTINLLLKRASDNADIIWTLHRVWDQNKTSFHLVLILDDGSQDELSFVRKVTADDINRLANLYARSASPANVANSGDQLSPAPTGVAVDGNAAGGGADDGTPATAPINPSEDDNAVIGGTNGGAVYTRAQFKRWLAANSSFRSGRTDINDDETQYLYFDHNGSIAKATIVYPAERSVENWTMTYEVPRPGMLEAGAKPGDVIFSGQPDLDTGALSGTSYIFNKKCGKFAFDVREQNQNLGGDGKVRILIGNAPVVDSRTCQVVRYKEVGLDFEQLFDGIVVEKKE
jgi:hypothetical protein